MQFMTFIDKGRAKKKEKKNNNQLKNSDKITRVVPLVTLSMICPFFHENHGAKTREKAI